MKTTSLKFFRVAPFLLAVLLWLTCFSLPAVTQAKKIPQQRFFIGFAAGFFFPQQETFREIYNHAIWPMELRLDWDIFGSFSVFGAARYLETSGSTVSLFPELPAETHALHWQMATLRLGLNYRFGRSRFAPFAGMGGSFSFFREQWRDVALNTDGKKAGFFFQAGGRYRLNRFWQALAQLDYSVIPAGIGSRGKVHLGGLTLLLGLMAGLF